MSQKLTNFQKIREFHQTFGLDDHNEHQLDIFENKKLLKLRLDLIQEEFNELKQAILEKDFGEVRDAIGDILYVTYGAAASFGINADRDYDIIHRSNMSKAAQTEEIAKASVNNYIHKYEKGESPYDTPNYRLSDNGKYYIIYNESSGKILKAINYTQVNFTEEP